MLDIPCFLTKQGFHFANLEDLSVEVKFMADTATATVDDIYLTQSEIYMTYYEIVPS